ncbi:MAG: phage portal protein family protein, partial [Terriglobales bacterium]
MNIAETLRGALRRLAGGSASGAKRRTLPLPSILNSYGPRSDRLPKPTPANLRRFAETPVARKAINTIKDRVVGMRWRIQPKNARDLAEVVEGAERIRVLTDNFDAPNPDDSFRSLAEQVLEDVIVGGFGAIEVQVTGDAKRPLALWPVDGATIRLRTDWNGEPSSPRYAQATGRFGPEAHIELADDELIYIRLNPRSHTPFGLG